MLRDMSPYCIPLLHIALLAIGLILISSTRKYTAKTFSSKFGSALMTVTSLWTMVYCTLFVSYLFLEPSEALAVTSIPVPIMYLLQLVFIAVQFRYLLKVKKRVR